MLGAQKPRIGIIPDGVDHPDADAFVEFAEACGRKLFPWQEFALRTSLRRTGRGSSARWAAFTFGLCVARQNGKSALSEIRELGGPLLLGERLIIHSAHLGDTVRESFLRMQEIIEANEWLSREIRHVRRQNGHEYIEFHNGGRIRFRTRTLSGGRGYAGADLVAFDEAMYLSEEARASLIPTLSTSPDPQLWFMGSAVDQMIHPDGVVFSELRKRALEGEQRVAYCEWSMDADGPESVTAEMASDLEQLALASPALGYSITPGYIADERRMLSPRSFAVERCSVGAWFTGDEQDAGPITLAAWNELIDGESQLGDPVCLAFDVSPDRRSSIVAAGRNQDGDLHVEVIECKEGTFWLPERLAQLIDRHQPECVVFAASSPAASVAPDIRDACAELGIDIVEVSVEEHAAACGRLVDRVNEGEVKHLGSAELANAIRGAATRPYGDAWLWSRKSSAVDISPLVGATLAVDAAANTDGDPGVMIF